jgi:starch phosphorylase
VIIATGTDHPEYVERHEFTPGKVENGLTHYSLSLTLTKPGSYNYGIRIFPKNKNFPTDRISEY